MRPSASEACAQIAQIARVQHVGSRRPGAARNEHTHSMLSSATAECASVETTSGTPRRGCPAARAAGHLVAPEEAHARLGVAASEHALDTWIGDEGVHQRMFGTDGEDVDVAACLPAAPEATDGHKIRPRRTLAQITDDGCYPQATP